MKLLVATSELIDDSRSFRIDLMRYTFEKIARFHTDYTKIVVYVNNVSNEQITNYAKNFQDIPVDFAFIPVTKELYHPYEMCWEHKTLLPKFVESTYTHFMYYENDLEIKQHNIDYWLETRALFKRNNLNFVPCFHRIEKNKHSDIFSLDICFTEEPQVITVESKRYAFLSSPYHAMYIMDRELAAEHLDSRFFAFDRNLAWHGISERAALGNLYDNVPEGYPHRGLVPVDEFSQCWIHHLPNKFVNMPNDTFGKLKIDQIMSKLKTS